MVPGESCVKAGYYVLPTGFGRVKVAHYVFKRYAPCQVSFICKIFIKDKAPNSPVNT